MGNGIGGLREGCARANGSDLNWRGVRLAVLFLLVGCGGTAAPGGSAGAGGAASEASGGSPAVSEGGAALGGSPQDGSGGLSPGGAALGGSPQDSSGGLSQGGAGAPSQPSLEPVRVIRGDPMQDDWWDLTVRGVALESYEGKIVTVRIGIPDRDPERLGSGQARVEAGAFELLFPKVWENWLYKQKLVWIDVDGDDWCDPVNDQLFADHRATATSELTVRGSGARQQFDLFSSRDPAHCELFNSDWPSQ